MNGAMMSIPWMGNFTGIGSLILIGIFIALKIATRYIHAVHSIWQDRSIRRPASVTNQINKLAYMHDGLLSVSDLVAETGLSFKSAEKILDAMVDNSRVNVRISDSGVILYEFAEILPQNRHLVEAGAGGTDG
ncbi:MAG TPA: hypothetical protein VMV83_02665 [Rectinemataceae bacterium]|nr:hypothetical protein [Rectinemataceae bacterium]